MPGCRPGNRRGAAGGGLGRVAALEHCDQHREGRRMSETSKLGLPFLFAGQAQKELAHNEALQRLDSFLFPLLGEVSGRAPPARPAVGRCYIVPEKATGDWTGADRNLACFSEAGWRFLPPFEGLTAVRQADGAT